MSAIETGIVTKKGAASVGSITRALALRLSESALTKGSKRQLSNLFTLSTQLINPNYLAL